MKIFKMKEYTLGEISIIYCEGTAVMVGLSFAASE